MGLLSAAALHGAAHQQPQEFQVVTDRALRPTAAGKNRLSFIYKKRAAQTPTSALKTETGSMRVSSPEATALDLVRNPQAAGGVGNIVTVLSELSEKMDPKRLLEAAELEAEAAAAQRLGFLPDRVGAADKTEALAGWVGARRPRTTPLRPDRSIRGAAKDERWRLLVNERIEIDE